MYRTLKHFIPVYSVPVRHGNQVLQARQLSLFGWKSKNKDEVQKQDGDEKEVKLKEVPAEKAVAKRVADVPDEKAVEKSVADEVKLKEVPAEKAVAKKVADVPDEKAVAKSVADDTPLVIPLPEDSGGVFLQGIDLLNKYAVKYYPQVLALGGSIIGGRYVGRVISAGIHESIVEIVKGVPMRGRRLFSTGDTIRVDNVQGRVVDIRLMDVVLASKEGEIHLANSKFLGHNVVNLGRLDDLLDKFDATPPTLSLQANMKKLQEEILQLKTKVNGLEKMREEEDTEDHIVGKDEDVMTEGGDGVTVTNKTKFDNGDH